MDTTQRLAVAQRWNQSRIRNLLARSFGPLRIARRDRRIARWRAAGWLGQCVGAVTALSSGCMSDEQTVTVTVVSADDVLTHMDAISHLYQAAFSAPPFVWPEGEKERQRAMLQRLAGRPTFGAALAFAGTELIGFVYGDTLTVGTNWWEGFTTPVGPEVMRERLGRTFAVIDLAVREDWRRRGVGRRLMDTLLDGRPEERATLAVQPQSTGSHAFYAAVGGWEVVGRQHVPDMGFTADEFDIYVKDLRAAQP
ncbi:Acetyltransferase (GNAT) family [Nocardia africana]|uniref:Acetyltransferase (GNAT) family n=2 Tax=Nocardiaceae TaxID=85025 RepID=A0A378X4Z1_9NOCA|nr:Acetyltransferase (GNAT) family [Nocardia africana]